MKSILFLTLFASISFLVFGCRFGTRLGYNDQDLKQSQEVAEQYLTNLKNQKFDAAIELTNDPLKSQLTPERLKTDLDGRFEGSSIQSWIFKSHQIIENAPKRIRLLYQVQGTNVTREVGITTELLANPWRWKVASVEIPNDQAAIENAQQAEVVSDRFLSNLKAQNFTAAHQLLSPLGQKTTSVEELRELWKSLEQSGGGIKRWSMKQHDDTTANLSGRRQPYTLLVYKVESSKGYVGAVFTMVKTSSGWQVEGFQIRDDVNL